MAKQNELRSEARGHAAPDQEVPEVSTVNKRSLPSTGGRPPFRPTDEQRRNVETLAGLGLRHQDIRLLVINPSTGKPIEEKTLRRRFAQELASGAPKANAKVAQSLFQKAIGNGPQAVTAAIWFSKCRMGWMEKQSVEVEVKAGVLVAPAGMSPEEWVAAVQADNKRAIEPGKKTEEGTT